MKADRVEQIKAHANAIAQLLYQETDSEQVKTLEGIEETVRKHLIDYVNLEVAKLSWCAFAIRLEKTRGRTARSQAVAERKQEEPEA